MHLFYAQVFKAFYIFYTALQGVGAAGIVESVHITLGANCKQWEYRLRKSEFLADYRSDVCLTWVSCFCDVLKHIVELVRRTY